MLPANLVVQHHRLYGRKMSILVQQNKTIYIAKWLWTQNKITYIMLHLLLTSLNKYAKCWTFGIVMQSSITLVDKAGYKS